MEVVNQLNEIIEKSKELSLNTYEDKRFDLLNKDFSEVAQRVIDSAANYIIKSMPLPDAIKDILTNIKEIIKNKHNKNIISTAVKSSIREGMELIGLSTTSINCLGDLKKVAQKGGLITALKNGVEIVAKNYLKNNIVGDYVYNFFDKLESYIMNKDFIKKIESIIQKMEKKKECFLDQCKQWYSAYKNMDLKRINELSENLNNNTYVLKRYIDCNDENNIIQNMTALVNNKMRILSKEQERLCTVI